ncbi:MAG: hypothetical protein ABSG53_08940 [Thermoguttaceae bacterium]|jgi:hypothetical protein
MHEVTQILHAIYHPGIANVFKADRAESGRPYLVMELVEGSPMKGFSRRQDADNTLAVMAAGLLGKQ